jgi:hypothetical protein
MARFPPPFFLQLQNQVPIFNAMPHYDSVHLLEPIVSPPFPRKQAATGERFILKQKYSHNNSCLIFALQGRIEESAGLAETRALQLEKCLFTLQGEASASIYAHSTRRRVSASQEKFRKKSLGLSVTQHGRLASGQATTFQRGIGACIGSSDFGLLSPFQWG